MPGPVAAPHPISAVFLVNPTCHVEFFGDPSMLDRVLGEVDYFDTPLRLFLNTGILIFVVR